MPMNTRKTDVRLAAVLAVQILLLMFLTWRFGINLLDGDDSAEMVLANLLSREGGIISKNWYYSTEVRVLNNQIVLSLLFRFFSNWRIVRTLGTGILVSVLALSYIFMCNCVPEGERLKKWAPILLLPFSLVYYDIVLYGLYYIPHISIIFLSLGLIVSEKEKHVWIRCVFLILLSFVAGMGGIRIPAIGIAPAFAAAFCIYFKNKKSKRILMNSVVACAASGAGYLVNAFILSKYYTFMSHSYLKPTLPNLRIAKQVIIHTIQLFGAARPAFSSRGIVGGCGLLLFICITYMLAVIVKRRSQVSVPVRIVVLAFLGSWLITALISVFTNNGWANRYAIMPCMGFVPVLAEGVMLHKEKVRRYMTVIITGLLLVCSIAQVHTVIKTDKLKDVRPAYSYVLDSGMTFGYSTWEVGDVLTEISNGKIHMCKVQNFKNMHRWNWLMEKEYMKYAGDGPVFALLDKARFNYTDHSTGHFVGEWVKDDLIWMNNATVGFEDDNYIVLLFPSEKEFERITGSFPQSVK